MQPRRTKQVAPVREAVRRLPVIGPLAFRLYARLRRFDARLRGVDESAFPGSATYWGKRYRAGGTSGAGSYNALAAFKAEIVNAFVAEHQVRSVLEFGCGDGAQLALIRYPSYVGVARRFVGIYSSNEDRVVADRRVRHRHVEGWAARHATGWRLLLHVPNRYKFDPADPADTSFADFFFSARSAPPENGHGLDL